MIKVTVELLPFGFDEDKEILGEAYIYNDLTGNAKNGNYVYTLLGKTSHELKTGKIEGFPRKKLLAWDLIKRMLEDARK